MEGSLRRPGPSAAPASLTAREPRRLADAPIVAQLVVTIGLMLALMGLAASIWNANTSRIIPRFFGDAGLHVGETFLPYYRITTILTGIASGSGCGSSFTTHASASRCEPSSTTGI